jgi:uncharacterized membrane protein YdjX (TVP38/TMEM64 family)
MRPGNWRWPEVWRARWAAPSSSGSCASCWIPGTPGFTASRLRQNPSASFLTILVARATPLPDAPVKLVAAAGGYPVGLYALAILLGALPYYFVLAFLARKAADLAREFKVPWWVIAAALALVGLGLLVDHLRRRRSGSG